ETRKRALGLEIGRAVLEVDRDFLACRRAAFELHEDERSHRCSGGDLGKPALAENGGFERELRRESDAHFLFRAHRAGLVVDDGILAIGQQVDAMGAGSEPKRVTAERTAALAAHSRPRLGEAAAPRPTPAEEPGRDPEKPWPPEGARFRE